MRSRVLFAVWALATPAWAQSPRDVTGPLTLTPEMVMCTDVPVAFKPEPRLTLFAAHTPDDRFLLAKGEFVVRRSPDDGLAVGQRYIAGRLYGDHLKRFPRADEGFGDVRIAGVMTITALDEINALAQIDFACDGIEPGDFLSPYAETRLPLTATPLEDPDFSDRAQLVFGVDNRVLFGAGDTLSIDRGTLHGVIPGARYAIYRDKRNGQPLIYLGEAVVMTTNELTAKVVVTKAVDGLESGDLAVPRRKP